MKNVPEKEYKDIPNWKIDLKELVRLRHIRNHLAHEEGAFSEDICMQEDIDLIHIFYQRILEQSDPIAILYQKSKVKSQSEKNIENQINKEKEINNEKLSFYEIFFSFLIVIVIILIVLAVTGSMILINLNR